MTMQINEMIDITPEEMVAVGAACSAAAAVMWMMKHQWIERTVDKAMEVAENEAQRIHQLRLERARQAVEIYKQEVAANLELIEAGSEAWNTYLETTASIFNTTLNTSAGLAPLAESGAMMAIPSGGGTKLLRA